MTNLVSAGMTNFLLIGHLDVFDLMPALHELRPADWRPVKARGEINHPHIGLGASLLLRAHADITEENWLDDLPVRDTPALEHWVAMRLLLAAATNMIMAHPLAKERLTGAMGRAMISRLDPGSTIFWHVDDGPYHDGHARFHLALVTNPGCLLYSGPEVLHLEAGALCYFNNRCRHCAANWGKHYRLHLIFEMCKKGKAA